MLLDHPRRAWIAAALIVGGLLGMLGLRACAPADVIVDQRTNERCLGGAIGAWLRAEGCTDVLILDTAWQAPHLAGFASARAEGLSKALGEIPHRFLQAEGPQGRQATWREALQQSTPRTTLVSFFGVPPKAPLPSAGHRVVLVGEIDGSGLPGKIALPMPWRTIKPRQVLTAPIYDPAWTGTDQERFDLGFEVVDHPAETRRTP